MFENLEPKMKTPSADHVDHACTRPTPDPAAVLDELHTISALLVATLSIADSGDQVERCLSVASAQLKRVVTVMSAAI